MSKWRAETGYLARYAGSGAVNTLAGFAVIFFLMAIGVGAKLSNVVGYSVGFFLGFVLSKKLVFRSQGRLVGESVRYLIAFLLAFGVNMLILNSLLRISSVNAFVAQLFAAAGYTIIMYVFGRLFVFRPSASDS